MSNSHYEMIFFKEGNWASRSETKPDIEIRIDIDRSPRPGQLVNIVSIHGQNKRVVKEVSLSVEDVTTLIEKLKYALSKMPANSQQ